MTAPFSFLSRLISSVSGAISRHVSRFQVLPCGSHSTFISDRRRRSASISTGFSVAIIGWRARRLVEVAPLFKRGGCHLLGAFWYPVISGSRGGSVTVGGA